MLQNHQVNACQHEYEFSDKYVPALPERQLVRYRHDSFGLWNLILKESGHVVRQAGKPYWPGSPTGTDRYLKLAVCSQSSSGIRTLLMIRLRAASTMLLSSDTGSSSTSSSSLTTQP